MRDRYNGGGFVRSDDSHSSQFADVQATERKGGAYPLPFKAEGGAYPLPFNADGNSLWSGKFRYYTVDGNEDEVAKQKSESAFHRSMDHPVLNRIRSSWRATRKPRGRAVEVSLFRVSLPHIGDLKTLRALVAMGPDAIDIFATPAVNICVST